MKCFKLLLTTLAFLYFTNTYGQGDPNILVEFSGFDPTFESGQTTGLWGGSSISSSQVNSGSNAAALDNNSQWGGGLEILITGLSPNTKYELSAMVKHELSNGQGTVFAKEFGGQGVSTAFSSTNYEKVSVEFTTGSFNTSAKIGVYNPSANAGLIYTDDLELYDLGPDFLVKLDPIEDTDYHLVWSDEFNTDGAIDTTKWDHERGFQRNNEAQYYHPDNLIQKDGDLVISAIREQFANEDYDPSSSDYRKNRQYANWTSGSIYTRGTFDFLYGRVECRAKVTNLTGTWPAIWTVGQISGEQTYGDSLDLLGCQTNEWPAAGEIDIMENYGGKILGNYAVANKNRWSAKWDARAVEVSKFNDPNWADKYHIWTLDWTEDKLRIFVDGVFINEMSTDVANHAEAYDCPGKAPFKNSPQMLWLNLALGGNAGGSTANLPDSTVYLVDYIRVYQKETDTNLISDGGFESGTSNNLWGGSTVVQSNTNSGDYAVKLDNNDYWGGGYEKQITGLKENTTYVFSAAVKSTAGGEGRIGVKEHGAAQAYTTFSNSVYNLKSIEFTTGVGVTSAKVYVYHPKSEAGYLYADNLFLREKTTSNLRTKGGNIEDEIQDEVSFSVYPNPVSDELTVLFVGDEVHDFNIMSLEGKVIKSLKLRSNQKIDVSTFIRGVYILNDLTTHQHKKFIVK
ncbi:family 16 glycosylhydrolase [Flammeovirga sp. EKP202]|uniref:family 16 glycosylhydrolase n=1 Tax=Flammeovirga sp. EKP202 TaxID=2770592 RepID=UPI00165F9EAE|nr:family 16 glycosylhydrolase [Flammeovirga sp. EKP202]MBD0401734.1 family 16 glycosylhydrolase [Flammeovirga sp. EKP202]